MKWLRSIMAAMAHYTLYFYVSPLCGVTVLYPGLSLWRPRCPNNEPAPGIQVNTDSSQPFTNQNNTPFNPTWDPWLRTATSKNNDSMNNIKTSKEDQQLSQNVDKPNHFFLLWLRAVFSPELSNLDLWPLSSESGRVRTMGRSPMKSIPDHHIHM